MPNRACSRSLDRVVDNLKELIRKNLRRGDIAARCSVSQFILLLLTALGLDDGHCLQSVFRFNDVVFILQHIGQDGPVEQVERAYGLGATDFITRPFDALIVHKRVVNTIRG